MRIFIAFHLIAALTLSARADEDSPPAACGSKLASVVNAWRGLKARHYGLAHTRESVRAGLRSPAARRAFNARQLAFEDQMRPRAIESKTLITHAAQGDLEADALARGLNVVVIQNARRYLYVRGHGLRQVSKGWAILVRADHLVVATYDPGGARRLPPQDPLAVTYW